MEFTEEQFKDLLSNIGSRRPKRSLAKCAARYNGYKDPKVLEVFLSTVETHKHCEEVSDQESLNDIHFLLEGEAALWWEGVKDSAKVWNDFLSKIRNAFAPKKPAYIVYQEIMSLRQLDAERTADFISSKRLLFSQLPKPGHSECQQIDMIYSLLNSTIQNAIPRFTINSFEGLLEAAEEIEKKPKKSKTRRGGKKRCNFCRLRGHVTEVCLKRKKMMEEVMAKKMEKMTTSKTEVKQESPEQKTVVACYGCGAQGFARAQCPDCNDKLTPLEDLPKNIMFY